MAEKQKEELLQIGIKQPKDNFLSLMPIEMANLIDLFMSIIWTIASNLLIVGRKI